jgi:hypothetical protein
MIRGRGWIRCGVELGREVGWGEANEGEHIRIGVFILLCEGLSFDGPLCICATCSSSLIFFRVNAPMDGGEGGKNALRR